MFSFPFWSIQLSDPALQVVRCYDLANVRPWINYAAGIVTDIGVLFEDRYLYYR